MLYTSKLSPKCPLLWQKPKDKPVNFADETWYQPRRLGHNPLETFMKILSENAALVSGEYTNHSICSTCISWLDSSGFEARYITAISIHKSESTIKEYSVKCPENKRKEMFDALASPLQPKKSLKLHQIANKM